LRVGSSIYRRFPAARFPGCINLNPLLDLSAGLLAWIYENGWGYDVYVQKDYPGKRFKSEFYPDDRIKATTVTKTDMQ